jgi:hypothetical protein
MRRHLSASLISLAALAAPAAAQTTSELVLKPWPEKLWGETVDKLLFQQQGDVKGEPGRNAQVFWWDSVGRFRLDTHDPDAPSLAYRILATSFDTNSRVIPDTLDEIDLAAGFHLGDVGDFHSTLVIGAGYSGDNLFATEDGLYGIGHLLFERKFNDTDSVVIGVGYDGSSSLFPDIPYPEFAFVSRREPVMFSLGYPYNSVHWDINPKLALDVSYTVPYSGEATLEYSFGGGFSVFGNYTNFFNAFYQSEARREERIFYEMRRAEVGVRYLNPNIFRGMALDAAIVVGYAFDQQFSTGWDVRDRDPLAEITDEPYIGIVIRGTF